MAANAQARLKDDWKTSQSEAISSAKTVLRRGLWQPQGLREITLSFASEKDFTVDLLHPLPRLQQLQSLTLENRGAVQPTIMGLEVLQGSTLSRLSMKGCLLCGVSGIDKLAKLVSLELHHCILMLVWPTPGSSSSVVTCIPSLLWAAAPCGKRLVTVCAIQGHHRMVLVCGSV